MKTQTRKPFRIDRHFLSTRGLVWLLAAVGLGTGALMLGTIYSSLQRIRTDRVAGDIIHQHANDAISVADDLLSELIQYSDAGLQGNVLPPQVDMARWQEPFADDTDRFSEFVLAQLRLSSKRLSHSLQTLHRHTQDCQRYYAQQHQVFRQWEADQRETKQALAELRESIAKIEGQQFLQLAMDIRDYRHAPEADRADVANRLLQQWTPDSSLSAALTELADLAVLCDRLIGERAADSLVDIKDNRLQPAIARLRRLIGKEDSQYRDANQRQLRDLEFALFGRGFRNDRSHQTVQLGDGGLYRSCAARLETLKRRQELYHDGQRLAGDVSRARMHLFVQVENTARHSANQAAALVSSTWERMAQVGSVLAIIFLFLTYHVVEMVGRQFNEIAEQSIELAEKTEELQASSEYLELLALVAKYTDNSVVITDQDARIEWVNDGFQRITGYRLAEAHGRQLGSFCHGELTDKATLDHMRQQLANHQGVDVELINYHRSGRPFWLAAEVRPIRDENGDVIKFVAVQSDITEKRAREGLLRLLRNALDHANDAMFTIDREGQFADVNEVACSRLGYLREELLAKNVTDLVGCETLADWEQRWETIKSQKADLFVSELTRQDSTTFPVEISAAFTNYDGREYICAFARDITDRLQAEAERQKLNDQLIDASRITGMAEVATGVLHNVGNILNSVNVSCSLIQDRVANSVFQRLERASELIAEHQSDFGDYVNADPQGKKLPEYLLRVTAAMKDERQAVRDELRDLLDNVGHIKQIVSVQQSTAKLCGIQQELCPVGLVEDAITANKATLANHHVSLECDFSDDVPTLVSDKHRILQILINLIKNAKDAIVEHAPAEPNIVVELRTIDGHIEICVRDNGIGIAADKMDMIFGHGYTTKASGHGFGLHASANAATELGGSLSVSSPGVGQGATFCLRLPQRPSELDSTSPAGVAGTEAAVAG